MDLCQARDWRPAPYSYDWFGAVDLDGLVDQGALFDPAREWLQGTAGPGEATVARRSSRAEGSR